MALSKISAKFQTTLAAECLEDDITLTLSSVVDGTGNNLSGYYCFVIDEGTDYEEFILGSVDSSTGVVSDLTRGLDYSNPTVSVNALKKDHYRGAIVKITNFSILEEIRRILTGTDTIESLLQYESYTEPTEDTHLASKKYVDDSIVVSTGDVTGPSSATDEHIAVFDGVTGKLIKDGGNTIAEIIAGTLEKASTSDINVGTNDAKYITPLGLANSDYKKESEILAYRLDEFATPNDTTDLNATTTYHGLLPKLSGSTTEFLRADGTWVTPTGSGDVAGPASSETGNLASFGDTTGKALIDSGYTVAEILAVIPSVATSSTINTGTDNSDYVTALGLADSNYKTLTEIKAIKLDDFGIPDDNTDLNATTSYHGLLRKLNGSTTQFLRGDGSWATPASAGDVVGPSSATNLNIAVFDGVTGKLIKDGGSTIAEIEANIPSKASFTEVNTGTNDTKFATPLALESSNYVKKTGTFEANNVAIFSDTTGKEIEDGGKTVAELLARANHTGTQAASTISDFDAEVSNNTDVAANTSARHVAVTVTDSGEIDFTLTGQDITASLKTGSIDVLKLDAGVQSSLGLADSAIQTETDPVFVASQAYNIDADDITNLGNLSGTNSGDQESSDFTHNNLSGLNDGTDYQHITQTQKNALHSAVTVLDSDEIDFTLTGQQITAVLKNGSIDETKLDTSVNASLDLADSAIQSADLAAVATSGSYSDLSDKPTTLDDLTPASSLIIGNGTGGWTMITPSTFISNNNISTNSNTQTLTNKTLTNSNNVLGGVTMTLGSDADGDVYYRSSNVLTRLAKGTAGQVLTMNAGATAPEWAAVPAGFADPMTTRGDIIYRNSSNTTARLGVGTNGQVLTTDGTDLVWGDAAESGASTALDNLASVAINTSLISDTNNTDDIGSTGIRWKKGWFVDMEITNLPTIGGSTLASQIKLDDLATPDDNTDLDVSTSRHGLCPKAPNIATQFLRGDGTWAVPIGGPTFWEIINSPTRVSNTQFTCTTAANSDIDNLLDKTIVVRWEESGTQKVAVIESVSESSGTVTVNIKGDNMASIDSSTLEYSLIPAKQFTWSLAGSVNATGTNVSNTNIAQCKYRALAFQFFAGTAGNGTTTIDVNDDGTSITSTKASITTTNTKSTMVASTSTIASNSALTIDIDAVAATTKITDAYCYLFCIENTLLYKD